MPGGVDIATLGLKVDFTEFVGAKKAVDDFAAAGAKAEQSAQALGTTATQEAKRAEQAMRLSAEERARELERFYAKVPQLEAQWRRQQEAQARAAATTQVETAEDAAMRSVEAARRVYENQAGRIKVALLKGTLTPREAEQAGRQAAMAYNQAVVRAIDTSAPSLSGDTFRKLSGNLKDVGAEGRKAGLGLGRLNDALVTVARQTTGMNTVTGKLLDTVGTFAIGTAYMIPVLAGLAAIGAAWSAITEEARKAKKAQEEAADAADQLIRLRDLGPAGPASEQLAAIEQRLAGLRREAEALKNAPLQIGAFLVGGASREDATIEAERVRAGAVAEVNRKIVEDDKRASALRQRIYENLGDEQERIDAKRLDSLREEIRLQQEAAAAAKEYADQMTRALDGGQARLDAVRNRNLERRATGQNASTDAFTAIGFDLGPLKDLPPTLKLVGDESGALRLRLIEQYEATQQASVEADGLVQAVASIGGLFGEVGESIGEVTGQFAGLLVEFDRNMNDIAQRLAAGLISKEQAEAAGAETAALFRAGLENALVGGLVGGIGAIFSAGIGNFIQQGKDRQREAEELRRAQADFRQALNEFVDELVDRSRFEQLRKDARDRAQELVDGFNEAFKNVLGGNLVLPVTDDLEEFFANLPAGQPYWTPEMQARWQQIIDGIEADLARVERQRQEEIASLTDDIAVRTLVAQGRDEEAEAMRRQIERDAELARARELEDEAVLTLLQELYALEDAALEAAAAVAEANRTFEESQTNLSLDEREAILRGDDEGAAAARAQARRDAETRDAREAFDAGDIGIDTFRRWIAVINEEFVRAVEDAAAATRAAADAAAFSAQQEMQNLQLRLLAAQGNSEAAFLLRQQMELEQALFEQRSEQYIALLLLVQAEERAANERARQTAAAQEQARAMEEASRAIDGTARALNGPAGLVLALRRYQTILRAGAPNALGLNTSGNRAGGGTTVNVQSGAIVIDGSNLSANQIADAVLRSITKTARAGGGNRLTEGVV